MSFVCETVQAGQRLGHVCVPQKLVKARAALLLLPTHVVRQAIPRRLVPHPNGRCHMPAPRPAAKDVHKTSELSFQPLQSHSSQAKLCHAPAMPNQAILTHPTHTSHEKCFTRVHDTICHQPSQTAEQPRQACHCCARAVLAHPTSHATAVPELTPRVRIRCFSRFANGHEARRPDARRDQWSRTHGRTLIGIPIITVSPCRATGQAKLHATPRCSDPSTSHVPEQRPSLKGSDASCFANGHEARRPDARRDRWSRTHGRTLSSTNHHRQMASPCKATSRANLQAMQPPPPPRLPPPKAAAAAKAADAAAGHCCQSIAKQPASWQ